jgi:hypothetical protein
MTNHEPRDNEEQKKAPQEPDQHQRTSANFLSIELGSIQQGHRAKSFAASKPIPWVKAGKLGH